MNSEFGMSRANAETIEFKRAPLWFEYSVVLHVHSRYSDGSGSVLDILEDAQASHIDVLLLTDHDTRKGAEDPGEGYYGRTLLLVGGEITPPQNHLLAFFTRELPSAQESWAEIVNQVSRHGGLSFVAHPNDLGNRILRLPSYRWTEREIRGFTGLEIWNHLSHWSNGVKGVISAFRSLLNPWKGLEHPRAEDLALWDQLAQEALTQDNKGVVGIGGTDAHAVVIGRGWFAFKVFPYRVSFGTIRTQVYLTEPLNRDVTHDRGLIKDALGQGRCAVMAYHYGSERGFRLWAESGKHSWPMGSQVPLEPNLRLKAISPVPVSWGVFHNGTQVSTATGYLLDTLVEYPGVYRVELYRGKRQRGWLYPNPVYVVANRAD